VPAYFADFKSAARPSRNRHSAAESYRDVEELLTERSIEVDQVTVYRWVQRFTPLLTDAAQFTRHSPGDRRFVDET